MSRTTLLTALLAVLAAGPRADGQEPEILAVVSPERVYEGRPVRYTVILNHFQNPSTPELAGFDDFQVTSLGQQSLNSQRLTINNGRVSEVIRRGRQYSYQLTPLKTGKLTIPGPTATVDGRVIEGPQRTLTVIPAEDQDTVFLKITSDRASVYPMQPFTVTLSVQIKGLPEPYSKNNPLAVPWRTPPALQIPWAVDDDLPDGLEPEVDWQGWLGTMQSRSAGGFSINHLRRSSVMSLLGSPAMTFEPRSRQIVRRDRTGSEVNYWQYDFPRAFVSEKVGTYQFGPVTVDGPFATRIDARREPVGERIYAIGKRIEVRVRDVPRQGRPETFTGAVGQFRLTAELEPKRVKVGDPMTLILKLTGRGTLGSVSAPDLAGTEAVAGKFKVYEATEEIKGDTCSFSYSLRPREEGIEEFPSIEVACFDVQSEQYVTLATDPIPITVAKATRLESGQIVAAPRGFAPGSAELEARSEGVFANVTDLGAVGNEAIRPRRWLAALGSALALYVLAAGLTVRFKRLTSDKALLRRRAAVGKARARLRRAVAELEARRIREGTELLQAAVLGLVADAADLPPAGLTGKDVRRQLEAWDVEEDLVARVNALLETCDAGRYGASPTAVSDMRRQAEALLEELIRSLSTKRRFR